MKRALLLVAAVLAVVPACAAVESVRRPFLSGTVLDYDQYLAVDQSADPPFTAATVMQKLGSPKEIRRQGDVIREIDYHAASFTGEMKIATFYFDRQQKLVNKHMW